MMKTLNARDAIYNHFHGSDAGPQYFFSRDNADAYAAYYTSMYLIADTGGAIYTHLKNGFSKGAMYAYLEFWGIMQAIVIQQDAIIQIYKAVIGKNQQSNRNPHGRSYATTEIYVRGIRHIAILVLRHPNELHGEKFWRL